MASIMPVLNETKSRSTRMSKEGRKLTYQLTVIQQPERARACGSGAKSSADRRPVDPPPVVELRIFEGENAMNDITFSYNANFFLFATLENARPIAQGRVQQAPQTSPVLTGVPVSGMAYLDRPSPAGYFLFPDLSVRHEGKYRLGFTLFEDVKSAKDADAKPALNHPEHPANKSKPAHPMSPKQHVDWRLEVKSKPFTVFSAKKFPGLAESTSLSRIVAEQGCRVRIRRDVRMRRRETKAAEFEEYEDDAYARARATASPDPYQHHNGHFCGVAPIDKSSNPILPDNHPAYGVDQRTNGHSQNHYAAQNYPQGYPTPQSSSSGYSNPSFNVAPANQYQPVQQNVQNIHNMQPIQVQAQANHYPPSNMNYLNNAPASSFHAQHLQGQHIRQGSTDSAAATSRHTSLSYPQTYNTPMSSNGLYSEQGYDQSQAGFLSYHNSNHPSAAVSISPEANGIRQALPPLKMPAPLEAKHEVTSTPATHPPSTWPTPAAALPSPGYEMSQAKAGSYAILPMSNSVTADRARSTKRQFQAAFDASQHNQPFRNGMRPSEALQGIEPSHSVCDDDDDFDASFELEALKMQYKRADGTEISRRLPNVE